MSDCPLGILCGVGGFICMRLGAKTQKFVPQKFITVFGPTIMFLAGKYIAQHV